MPGAAGRDRQRERECVALALFLAVSSLLILGYRAFLAGRAALAWLFATSPRRLGVRVAAAFALAMVAVVLPVVAYVSVDREALPDLRPFLRFEPPGIGRIDDRDGQPLIELAREYRRVVLYRDLPPVMREAIVAAEDKRFFSHQGVDYWALPRVAMKALASTLISSVKASASSGRLSFVVCLPQGGSTVTQQLVRNYFLSDMIQRENERVLLRETPLMRVLAGALGVRSANKLFRKVEEIRLSLWLEQALTDIYGTRQRAKEEILSRYASFVYLGNGRYGVAAASEYYFGRRLESYTNEDADKAAMLAGIPKSPSDYAPAPAGLERPKGRRNQVLALMAERGFLERDALRRFTARPLALQARSPVKTEAPAAVEHVLAEIRRDGAGRVRVSDLFEGRVHVRATILAPLQQIANQALERGIEGFETRHPEAAGRVQGAVVVLANRDGAVLAETGGRRVYGERAAQYYDLNRALDARRQAGSAMKPIVYLAAFVSGLRLDTPVPDEPISISMGRNAPAKWVANYDGKFKGTIPLRQALAESRNCPTIWIAKQVGVSRILATAQTLGIKTRLAPYISTALGASEVSLLELANAYRTIASGIVARPHVVATVTDNDGSVVLRGALPQGPLAVPASALLDIQEALRGNVRLPSGTAHALGLADFPIPVMGKTGTTNGFRDALFVGSTYGPSGITVAVRIGFDDNSGLGEKETGARAALPVFREIVGRSYSEHLLGPTPRFPDAIEADIDNYLAGGAPEAEEPMAIPVRPLPATGDASAPLAPLPAVVAAGATSAPGR